MEYTEEQREVVAYLRAQLNEKGHNVIVSGAGGVGKSLLLSKLITELLQEGFKIVACAATGKATGVIRSKIYETLKQQNMPIPKKESLMIETIAKITKESKVLGLTDSGETLYTNTWRNPKSFGEVYDILFIDEISMVPGFISEWWIKSGIRVFGFGDYCQIPSVLTEETLKEIRGMKHDLKIDHVRIQPKYGVDILKKKAHKTLYKVLRSDNEIALLCADLRDFTMTKDEIIGTIKKWATKTSNVQYSDKWKDLEKGKDWQIIAYTNETCKMINNGMAIGKEYPDFKDKIILKDNLNPLNLYNGDVMLFEEFLSKIGMHNRFKQRKLYVCMKWQGQMPRKDSSYPIEREFFYNYVHFKEQSNLVNKRRIESIPELLRKSHFSKELMEQYILDIEQIDPLEENPGIRFNKIIEAIYNIDIDVAQWLMEGVEDLPRLYMVETRLAYAITAHSSQGSEFPQVCYIMEKIDRPLLYTAISRAKEKVKIINKIDYRKKMKESDKQRLFNS